MKGFIKHFLRGTLCCVVLSSPSDGWGKRAHIPTDTTQRATQVESIEFLKEELTKPRSNYVMVVAHRGDWHGAPENSIAAMEKAMDLGVDMVEVDVRQTKDGVLVLMHDKTLDRTTNGAGLVANHTLEEIKKLRLKNHKGKLTKHRIPTLEEAMRFAKGKVLVNIDKGDGYFEEIGEILKETGTFDIAVPKSGLGVTAIASRMPYIKGSPFMAVISLDKNVKPLQKIDDYIAAYRPNVMEISFQTENSAFFQQYEDLLSRNVKIWMTPCAAQWSAGHHDDRAINGDPDGAWGWLIDHGATILLTNEPKALIEYLEKSGRR
ncbi:glycerophosphodiester phosphodiesterase family protein [Parapedobacter sp.]